MDQEMGWEGGYRVDELNIGTDCLPFFPSLPESVRRHPKNSRKRYTYSSKCLPRFGSALRFATTFRTLLSGRTTMIGTGE